MESKDAIYKSVAQDNPEQLPLVVKLKQGLAYVKALMAFYKHGVSAVWHNNKRVRSMTRKEYRLSHHVDSAGAEAAIAIPSFAVLARDMAQQLYIDTVENRTQHAATTGEVVHAGSMAPLGQSAGLFSMTRAEFQMIRRTPGDFVKIPAFAVIFLVFMEMTPVLCYAFPEVTPLTCVLPSILPRIWRRSSMEQLELAVSKVAPANLNDYALKTAYNVPVPVLRALCRSLRLKTRYLPDSVFPEAVLRARLQQHFNYLTVDNYYLSGLNNDGNVWDLTDQELVMACLERNLVSDPAALVKTLSTGTVELRKTALTELRLKLIRFIVDFSSSNVGYLAIGHLLEKPDVGVATWRE